MLCRGNGCKGTGANLRKFYLLVALPARRAFGLFSGGPMARPFILLASFALGEFSHLITRMLSNDKYPVAQRETLIWIVRDRSI